MTAVAAAEIAADFPSGVPVFELNNIIWQCWITDDGHRYEWRSPCARYLAGRGDGASFWSSFDGRAVGHNYGSLKDAMQAATRRGVVS